MVHGRCVVLAGGVGGSLRLDRVEKGEEDGNGDDMEMVTWWSCTVLSGMFLWSQSVACPGSIVIVVVGVVPPFVSGLHNFVQRASVGGRDRRE